MRINLTDGTQTGLGVASTGSGFDFRRAATAPDGRSLATGCGADGTVRVWQVPGGKSQGVVEDANGPLAFSPDGSQIAYSVAQGNWDTYTISPLGGEPPCQPSV